jgi:hypothetical protein
MAKRPSKQGLSTGILVVLLAGVLVSQALQAGATHKPADKALASGDAITDVAPAPNAAGMGTDANNIATATLRTSGPSDLILTAAVECSILTDVINNAAGNGATSTGQAEGRIQVWIVVDDSYIVPITNVSSNPQPGNHSTGTDSDKVTYCNRLHRQEITDTEDPEDGTDRERNFIRTKSANSFNWVALNMGPGIHTIDLRAGFDQPSAPQGTGSTASGLVGNRILVIEPVKMANDITV